MRGDRRLRYTVVLGLAAVLGLVLLPGGRDDADDRGFLPPGTAPTSVVLTTGTTTERQVGPLEAAEGRIAEVASITDGDTFRTTEDERVRFIGIDTPEVDDDQCFAAEATAALAALIPPGAEVRLVTDVDPVDRFGRTLAYVHRLDDDLDVGLQLATDGFALQLTVPPNVAREAAIGAAVASARDAGRGLWGPACNP